MNTDYLKSYRTKGYAIITSFFSSEEIEELKTEIDKVYQTGMKYDSSFRHQNLLYLIQQDTNLKKILRFCQWPTYENKILEKYRTDPRFYKLLAPLLGGDIKQIINQIIWKTPGSEQTSYGYHQDARFRRPESAYRNLGESFVQVALAVDEHREDNGCLVFIEGSHLLGNLKYITDRSVFEEDITEQALEELEINHLPRVNVLLKPGDIAIWHPFLLHGSGPNRSRGDRRTYLNGYVNAKNCDRGEWAFRDGVPVALSVPQLVQYEDLFTKPEPHYINGSPLNVGVPR